MAHLNEIVEFCNAELDIGAFDDYCPNGLQVEGRAEVGRVVSGVTASQTLLDAAVTAGADIVLVHHGYFWRNEPAPLVGIKGRRIRTLIGAGMSLLAYHLPLDAHQELGNNRQLGDRLGLPGGAPVGDLVWGCELPRPMTADELAGRVESVLGRTPLLLGERQSVRRVAWCTGAAQGYLAQAAAAGYDAFISGEVSEQTLHEAAELGLLYIAAGHHATERYGVQALGEVISTRFKVAHQFIDIANPV
ncbi:MAG: Nif3-like dinuclear metal center hexameric protein [Gammaproteobacteria bacterium]|nr:Nif3-like dinuclear metal center hexameric protein [Gammaproteobacteria bacterium]